LELPEAIKHAAPLSAKEEKEDRLVYGAGNALPDDLGAAVCDLVFMAAVVHHFDEAAPHELMRRIARARKPGGILGNWDSMHQDRAGRIRQIGSTLHLFFGFFTAAGAWSRAEVAVDDSRSGAAGRPGSDMSSSSLTFPRQSARGKRTRVGGPCRPCLFGAA
jgi:SAM-dependent methyltransferase